MNTRNLIALTLIIINILVLLTPATGSDTLKRNLLEEIISPDKTELFEDYGELALAKAGVQAVIQGMKGAEVTTTTRDWVNIYLSIVDELEKMTTLTKSQHPGDHEEALKMADTIGTSINTLKNYDIAERNGIPVLAERALKRFYLREGKFFEDLATNTEETKVRIEYEHISSESYAKGDMPSDASRMEFEAIRDERRYRRDMDRASEHITASREHHATARDPPSVFFGAAFMDILKARDSFENAEKLYEKHSDKELGNVKELRPAIDDTYKDLMITTTKKIAIYLLIISLFTGILWLDFRRWGEELDDTRLGEELIV